MDNIQQLAFEILVSSGILLGVAKWYLGRIEKSIESLPNIVKDIEEFGKRLDKIEESLERLSELQTLLRVLEERLKHVEK